MTTETSKVLTLAEVKEEWLKYFKNFWLLFKNFGLFFYLSNHNKVLTLEEAIKQGLGYYDYEKDGVYGYETKDGRVHLIIGGKNVLEGLKAVYCDYYGNGVYEYKTKDGKWHEGKVVLINQ